MEKIIKSMLTDTPLVINLENKKYMNIILEGEYVDECSGDE